MRTNLKDSFEIKGGKKLAGTITIQTSKNACLPIISASLLADGDVTIKNCPEITDLDNMVTIMQKLKVQVKKEGNSYTFNSANALNTKIDEELAKSMRSSIFLLGSTLSKFKTTTISMPGGCKIGKRPIDLHISAFKKLNVKVKQECNFLFFDAQKAKCGKIKLHLPSVGATENIIQFACKLKGKTTIYNAAKEPEIVDLCNFLNFMGAKILGAGTKKITIYGVKTLRGVEYTPIPDRIVAGTIMVAVAILGGKVCLNNVFEEQNEKLIKILSSIGCKINSKNGIMIISKHGNLNPMGKISTGYYPEFPTDLQSLIVSLACCIKGKTIVEENVFENRFLIVNELKKLGADIIQISKNQIEITGVKKLSGNEICALDLRGGASLVLAALASKGKSVVKNVHYIDRGYDHLENMLSSLGADIKRRWTRKKL